ncbi:RHS repeat-associated core domain-containing protein [Actinoplanes sp. NPDC051859]|uniref:RHS repeat-associated core domain-containing protein n=1 Tax=Actinoplanes sp. NPDC051859 TaxID=3363909 RepID=UPI0037BB79E9
MAQTRAAAGVSVVVLAASSLVAVTAGPAAAQPVQARVATPVIEPVGSPQSGPAVWLSSTATKVKSTAAARTASAAEAPAVPKGTGPVRNATQLSFSLTDRLQMQVNVGSGNLLLTSTELTLPGVADNVTLGAAYNSLLVGTSIANGALGPGWRTRSGADVRLVEASGDKSVTYVAADGVIGKFTVSGSGYKTPSEFKATLTKDGSGWKLTEHGSGKKLFFTSAGILDKTEDRNGNVTDYTHAGAQWTGVTSDKGVGSGRTVAVSYTDGKVSKLRQTGADNSWREASYAYDSAGRLQTIQSATPRKVMFEYDAKGDLTKITTKPDTYVLITYDGQHRVTSVNQVTDNATGQGSVTRLSYPTASKTEVADPRQDLSKPVAEVPHTTYELNDDERVTKTIDPAGNERSKTYTPFADIATLVTPEGGTVTNTFGANAGESMTKSASPTGSSASAAYANAASQTNPTANFQPSSSIDTQGNSSSFSYNGAGNKTSAKDALAAEAKVDYNDDGTVKKSTDPGNDGNSTVYAYDANKQLTKLTPPTGNGLAVKTFTYDAFGRLQTVTHGACTTTYEYSAEDRLMKVTYAGPGCPATAPVSYDYGLTGNLITRTDATGTTTYQYDQLNRLRVRSAPNAPAQTYVPDPAGNLERLTDGRGTTRYYYNSRNWLVRVDTAGGTRYNFAYDSNGNRTDQWFATDNENSQWVLRTTTRYDKSDRPLRITSTRKSGGPVFDTTYCYAKYVSGQGCSTDKADDTGIRQWQRNEITGAVSEFSHDKGNRLTKATNVHGKTYEYAYDTNGNRKTVKADGTETQSLTFNSANQVTTTNNTYDNRGNQTKVTEPTIGTLGHNAANQMTNAYGPGGNADYAYAGTDQVEVARVGALKLDYGMEDQHGMPWLQSWTNGTNPTVYVERDGIGTPLGLRIGGADYAYVLDGLGSVVAVVGSNNTVAATYVYDPYGVVQASTQENGLGQTNIIRYAGGTYDAATRLTKYGQRWYNPNQGRFTQQDNLSFIGSPRKGNRYAYAAGDPIDNVDPTGMEDDALFDFMDYVATFGGAGAIVGGVTGCIIASLPTAGAGCPGGAAAGGIIGGAAFGAFGGAYYLGRN